MGIHTSDALGNARRRFRMLRGQNMLLPLHAPSLSQPSASAAALRLSLMAMHLCSQLASAAKMLLLLRPLWWKMNSRLAALP